MIHEDLSFHAQAGIRVGYQFENEDGSTRDMTLATVEISVDNGFRKALAPDPLSMSGKILTLTGAELADLVGKKAQYVVLDKSQTPPFAIATGNLMVTGWL